MSLARINLNPGLKRLKDEGYALTLNGHGYLVLSSIPYVNSSGEISYGNLVDAISFTGDTVNPMKNHQVWFAGDYPCKKDGRPIEGIRSQSATRKLYPGMIIDHYFSNKPPSGAYDNFHHKMTRYAEIISNEACALDSSVTPRPFLPVRIEDSDSPFLYEDSASSRAGITSLALKCAQQRVAIVGLGGTGSYLLDLIAKTHVKEIHLFDVDVFSPHNAFRCPGAASLEELENRPTKVTYLASKYCAMRRDIIPHEVFITENNIEDLAGFDFVFVCVDPPEVRKLIFEYLAEQDTSFVDTGIDVQYIEETESLIGACRATACIDGQYEHFPRHVSLSGEGPAAEYHSNIQIAELNALAACQAVIRWKKWFGFYQDHMGELNSIYTLNTHALTRSDLTLNG